MTNLPEQAHQGGTALATLGGDDPYAMDQSMVTLPRLYLAQYQTTAFKRGLAKFGSIFVGIGAEDAEPVTLAEGKEPMSDPVRFYVHRLTQGFNYAEDPKDPKKLTFGPLGGTYAQALSFTGGDPRRVFQKIDYMLTVPDYDSLPVRFLMTGKWGGGPSRWINTQIGIMRQKDIHPLTQAFQIQARQTHNDKGDFTEAVVGIANVKAAQAKKDQELVASHAALLASTAIAVDTGEEYDAAPAANVPSLA